MRCQDTEKGETVNIRREPVLEKVQIAPADRQKTGQCFEGRNCVLELRTVVYYGKTEARLTLYSPSSPQVQRLERRKK